MILKFALPPAKLAQDAEPAKMAQPPIAVAEKLARLMASRPQRARMVEDMIDTFLAGAAQ